MKEITVPTKETVENQITLCQMQSRNVALQAEVDRLQDQCSAERRQAELIRNDYELLLNHYRRENLRNEERSTDLRRFLRRAEARIRLARGFSALIILVMALVIFITSSLSDANVISTGAVAGISLPSVLVMSVAMYVLLRLDG